MNQDKQVSAVSLLKAEWAWLVALVMCLVTMGVFAFLACVVVVILVIVPIWWFVTTGINMVKALFTWLGYGKNKKQLKGEDDHG